MNEPTWLERLNGGLWLLTELIAVSGLWLLGCLPVFTIGASTAAAYYTAVKAVRRKRGGIWRCYRDAFRQNLRQGAVCSVVLAAAVSLLVFYWLSLGTFSGGLFSVFLALVLLLALLLLSLLVWFFPVLSRFGGGLGGLLRMSLGLAFGRPLRTLGAAALLVACGALSVLSPVLLLLLPGLYHWAVSYLLEPALRAATDAEAVSDDPWFLE